MPLLASFRLSLCSGQERGIFLWPRCYPCAVAVTLSSAAKSFLWSVWRISDGVHLPCAVLTSRLTHGVHSQLICFPFVLMDTPRAPAASPSPLTVSSARLLAESQSSQRGRVQLCPLSDALCPAWACPGMRGRDLGSYKVSPSSFSQNFLLSLASWSSSICFGVQDKCTFSMGIPI